MLTALFAMALFVGQSAEAYDIRTCDADSPNYMLRDWSIYTGGCLVSHNGIYIALLHWNGYFKIIRANFFSPNEKKDGIRFSYLKAPVRLDVWSTKKRGIKRVILQNDGNLVGYDREGWRGHHAKWSTGTYKKGRKGRMVLLNDGGELVVYDGVGSTYGPRTKVLGGRKKFMRASGHWHFSSHSGKIPKKSGVFITKLLHDHEVQSTTNETPSGRSAEYLVNNCNGSRNATGSITLGGECW